MSGQTKRDTTFLELPDEILRHLFDRISTSHGGICSNGFALATTCRRMHDFYRQEYVRHLKFVPQKRVFHSPLEADELERALTRLPRANELSIIGFCELIPHLASSLRNASPHRLGSLKTLRLGGCETLTMPMLVDIIRECPALSHLEVNDCDVGDELVLYLAEHHTVAMQGLGMSDTCLSDSATSDLMRLTELEHLDMSSSRRLTDTTFERLGELRSLTALDLSGTLVTDNALCSALPALKLKSLRLAMCWRLTGAIVDILPRGLHVLNLTDTNLLDDVVAGRLFASVLQLEELYIGKTSFSATRELAKLPATLRVLDLHRTEVTEPGMECLSEMKNLERLNLANCRNVGDGVASAIARLRNLKSLRMRGSSITDMGVLDIANGPARAALSYLDLTRCQFIKNEDGAADMLLSEMASNGAEVHLWCDCT